MSKRYQVVKGSESCHWHFDAIVIDTKKSVLGHFQVVCRVFDLSRALAIADAMNMADEAPLDENTPAYQDRCGKEFDVHSALLYFPGGSQDPKLVLPNQIEINVDTGKWELYVTTLVDNHQYMVRGDMFAKHPHLLKLEAASEDINVAF